MWDPYEVFARAVSFDKASSAISSELLRDKDVLFLPPLLVLESIALEMYFKSIYISENKMNPKKDSDLSELFHLLTKKTQNAIEAIYRESIDNDVLIREIKKEYGEKVDLSLNKCLMDVSNIFIEGRYSYENRSKGAPTFGNIINATRQYILKTKPSWADAIKK